MSEALDVNIVFILMIEEAFLVDQDVFINLRNLIKQTLIHHAVHFHVSPIIYRRFGRNKVGKEPKKKHITFPK